MASQGPLSPGTATTPGLAGGGAMTNPNNIKVSDNAYATYFDGQNSVDAQNFGFSIPTGSTINGILFEVEKKYSGDGSSNDIIVSVIKANGTLGSQNKTAVAWTTSDAYASYGGASDLWAETWTAEDINDADFGLSFRSRPFEDTASIDHIRCTVYYTAGSSANTGFFGLM